MAHVSDGDEPDDDETLHGVYSADADIKDLSGCESYHGQCSWTQGLRFPLSQKAHTEASCLNTTSVKHHSEVVYRCDSNCWENLHSSDVRKTTVHAASRGDMW